MREEENHVIHFISIKKNVIIAKHFSCIKNLLDSLNLIGKKENIVHVVISQLIAVCDLPPPQEFVSDQRKIHNVASKMQFK